MYKEMSETAREEGFHALADAFAAVGKIEKSHEERYMKLAENLSNSEVFKRADIKVWYCRNCGHLEYGLEAPAVCPVCGHPQAYFEYPRRQLLSLYSPGPAASPRALFFLSSRQRWGQSGAFLFAEPMLL